MDASVCWAHYSSWIQIQVKCSTLLSQNGNSGTAVVYCLCSTGGAQSALSLNVLRSMAMLSATVLFIPFVSVLLQTFDCEGGHWIVFSSFECVSGVHIVCIVLVSFLIPAFIGLSVFMASVFFERDIQSESINAQVHGRWCIQFSIESLFWPTSTKEVHYSCHRKRGCSHARD